MNSIFGVIVGIISAVLSVFGFGQHNVALPPAQPQVVQVAQQSTSVLEANKPSVTIDKESLQPQLIMEGANPQVSGTASGVHTLSIFINGRKAGSATVDNGQWVGVIPNSNTVYDTVGTYAVEIRDPNTNDVLARGVLTVGAVIPYTYNMSQYTDADFGFSFWYPSGWTVASVAIQNANQYAGGTITKQVNVSNGQDSITIQEFSSPSFSITFPALSAKGYGPRKYYFDTSTHQWMTAWWDDSHASVAGTTTAGVSQNTIGGLHIFPGQWPYNVTIVPLNGNNFVLVGSDLDQTYLAKTIVATDPSVATPVGAAEQIKVIQAEKDAYAGQ